MILEELKKRIQTALRPPAYLIIRDEQVEPLAYELGGLSKDQDVATTALNIREGRCSLFCIPVRVDRATPDPVGNVGETKT